MIELEVYKFKSLVDQVCLARPGQPSKTFDAKDLLGRLRSAKAKVRFSSRRVMNFDRGSNSILLLGLLHGMCRLVADILVLSLS